MEWNIKSRLTTATAIGTLIGMMFYSSTFLWGASHAQYARADTVDYLFQKQIEVDIWRFEDELEELLDIALELQETDVDGRALIKTNKRILKLRKRLIRLETKLDDME